MQYELTYLIPTEIPTEKSSEITSRIKKGLVEIGGKIVKEESVRRKLAYPIKKHEQVDYLTIDFDLDLPKKIIQLENKLKLITGIIRYLIVENLLKPTESTISEIKKEGIAQAREKTPNHSDVPSEGTGQTKEEKIGREKVKIDELDKKLDEILEKDTI